MQSKAWQDPDELRDTLVSALQLEFGPELALQGPAGLRQPWGEEGMRWWENCTMQATALRKCIVQRCKLMSLTYKT